MHTHTSLTKVDMSTVYSVQRECLLRRPLCGDGPGAQKPKLVLKLCAAGAEKGGDFESFMNEPHARAAAACDGVALLLPHRTKENGAGSDSVVLLIRKRPHPAVFSCTARQNLR
jgi:hypothetical protein